MFCVKKKNGNFGLPIWRANLEWEREKENVSLFVANNECCPWYLSCSSRWYLCCSFGFDELINGKMLWTMAIMFPHF